MTFSVLRSRAGSLPRSPWDQSVLPQVKTTTSRAMRRIFLFEGSQAGVFHVTSRFLDRVYHFRDEESKDQFLKIVRAYEDLLGVEVLTFCIMSRPALGEHMPIGSAEQWLSRSVHIKA